MSDEPHEAAGPAERGLPPEEIRYPDGRVEHPRVRREKADVSFGWILAAAVAASCIAALQYYGFWRLYWWAMGEAPEENGPEHALAPPPARLPAEPRLEPLNQPLPGAGPSDIYVRLSAQQKMLERYGPTGEKGFVHIPIEQAIKQVTQRLPARKEVPRAAQKEGGLVDAGEPNSGRMLRKGNP